MKIKKANELVFSVRDNRIEIDPQYSKRIFEIFKNFHARDKYPGTGIGLSICRRIVERHDGVCGSNPNCAKVQLYILLFNSSH